MSPSSTKSLRNQPDTTMVPSEACRHTGALEEIILAQTYTTNTMEHCLGLSHTLVQNDNAEDVFIICK